ncbi:MAG TPA: PhzF family phenazine biosynthesis protein [Candidatus Krumholzibacteriaceae bacterium]|nr:PhzF family phenazine biosynthesis protein [Candidatus Krumholzibacteriaceae bacterium]
MRTYIIKNVDVFTTLPFHGYPSSVITSAEGLTENEMQKIAEEISLVEVAYITETGVGKSPFKIKFYTQSNEVNISGHSIISATFALIEEGRIDLNNGHTRIYIETNEGDIPVDVYFSKGDSNLPAEADIKDKVRINQGGLLEKIMIKQNVKYHKHSDVKPESIAEIFEIDPNEIYITGLPIEEVSTGLNHLLVPIKNLETIYNVKPDLIKLSILNRKLGVQTTDIFSLDTAYDCIAQTRHFAPAIGLLEVEASGMSSVAIGSYLGRHGISSNESMIFKQGNDRERLSKVYCKIDKSNEDFNSIYIGGLAATSIERKIEIDDKTSEIKFVQT